MLTSLHCVTSQKTETARYFGTLVFCNITAQCHNPGNHKFRSGFLFNFALAPSSNGRLTDYE